ncbi:MAG: shikimate kinase [Candidatus Aureabacteria bacterium]|nr:shikimate kinase [Candidatus Auribacterota bacterium]
MNIVLFGFMASGKSTVAKILSQKLNMKYIEMDDVIEKEAGMPIPEIFSKKGEQYFRNLEKILSERLSSSDNLIISTGGGVVLNEENIRNLRKNGITFSLMVSPENVIKRTEKSTHRPLLNMPDRKNQVGRLLLQRKTHYEKADHIIDTNGLSPENVADAIIKKLNGTS